MKGALSRSKEPSEIQLVSSLQRMAQPLSYESDLESLLKGVEGKRYILLGESTHGTSEFYLWRRAITKRIIEEQNVSCIVVEGDWPDCYRVNRYIKGYKDSGKSVEEVLQQFSRWPRWLWANVEMVDLLEWLKEYNKELAPHKKIGFYGMDVYSLWESLEQVISYLSSHHPKEAEKAKELYECFEPYGGNPDRYALATAYVGEDCESEVVTLLEEFARKYRMYPLDDEAVFSAEQNAFVVAQAEKYYRSMLHGDAVSWNNRDRSMVDTLYRLEDYHAQNNNTGTIIVWAHNTHIGDARFTDMRDEHMWNIGQLLRQEVGEAYVSALGFGTYKGSVVASDRWDSPQKTMRVPSAKAESWDSLLAKVSHRNSLFLFSSLSQEERERLLSVRGQRAIGVVYSPVFEHGNYVPTLLPMRYDGFIFIKESHALHPLHITKQSPKFPETYPSAL